MYSGLLTARLSPASAVPTVYITSVAPLRDLRPQSLPALLQILQTWESRCTSVVSDLEAQIAAIKATAYQRSTKEKKRQELVDTLVLSSDKQSSNGNNGTSAAGVAGGRVLRSSVPGQRPPSKRDLDQHIEGEDEEYEDEYEGMDLDEGLGDTPGNFAGAGGRGGGGTSRGAKRNRGRGSR